MFMPGVLSCAVYQIIQDAEQCVYGKLMGEVIKALFGPVSPAMLWSNFLLCIHVNVLAFSFEVVIIGHSCGHKPGHPLEHVEDM